MVNIPLFTWFYIHPRWLFRISEPSVAEPARVGGNLQVGLGFSPAWAKRPEGVRNLDIVKIPIKHTHKKKVFFPPQKKINRQLQKNAIFFG